MPTLPILTVIALHLLALLDVAVQKKQNYPINIHKTMHVGGLHLLYADPSRILVVQPHLGATHL